jgi:hypothetical protein
LSSFPDHNLNLETRDPFIYRVASILILKRIEPAPTPPPHPYDRRFQVIQQVKIKINLWNQISERCGSFSPSSHGGWWRVEMGVSEFPESRPSKRGWRKWIQSWMEESAGGIMCVVSWSKFSHGLSRREYVRRSSEDSCVQ